MSILESYRSYVQKWHPCCWQLIQRACLSAEILCLKSHAIYISHGNDMFVFWFSCKSVSSQLPLTNCVPSESVSEKGHRYASHELQKIHQIRKTLGPLTRVWHFLLDVLGCFYATKFHTSFFSDPKRSSRHFTINNDAKNNLQGVGNRRHNARAFQLDLIQAQAGQICLHRNSFAYSLTISITGLYLLYCALVSGVCIQRHIYDLSIKIKIDKQRVLMLWHQG